MVALFVGVPGSGKTLHAVKEIATALKAGKHVITNIRFNLDALKKCPGHYEYRGYDTLNPLEFVEYSLINNPESKEGKFLIVIDEAQVLINSRDFSQKDRMSWVKFITNHRHLGYDVLLITQYDKSIDKQIREVVEAVYLHKCLNRLGLLVLLPFKLFIEVEMFKSGSTKIVNGSRFFTVGRGGKYYNTHQTAQDIFQVFPEVKVYIDNKKQMQAMSDMPGDGDGGSQGDPSPHPANVIVDVF